MSRVIWDLETGPLDDHTLLNLCPPYEPKPFVPELDPGEFDPESVKYGAAKKPETRAQILKEKEERHKADREKLAERNEKARADWELERKAGEDGHFLRFREKAALSARTGFIVALGVGRPLIDGNLQAGIIAGEEQAILRRLWEFYEHANRQEGSFIGWNILGFDLPFAIQRSWILGVPVPQKVVTFRGGRSSWSPCLVDLMAVWTCGAFGSGSYCKMDDACAAMGLPRKNGDGAEFHRLWNGTPEERAQAEAYLKNDLTMTWRVAERMGVA